MATADQIAPHRQELLAGLSGRVMEVGCGNGLNFEHYPESVDEVVAIEPEPYLRGLAVEQAEVEGGNIMVIDGEAERLPAEDDSFDAVVCSLVLCSIEDPAGALAEIRRVLRPGGELRFYEHVLGDGRLESVQNRIDWLWPKMGGGCHCNRDTLSAISAAGFEVENSREMSLDMGRFRTPVSPHILGLAVSP